MDAQLAFADEMVADYVAQGRKVMEIAAPVAERTAYAAADAPLEAARAAAGEMRGAERVMA